MRGRSVASVVLFSSILGAEATDPRPAASDYPVHAAAGHVSIGAEYMVRSFQGRNRTFVTKDYLVVLVALYAPRFEKFSVSLGQLFLRLNRKEMIHAQMPAFVAASVKYPDWEQRPTVVAGGGVGDAGVIIGPQRAPRFPGDPRPSGDRLPRPPRVPEDRPGGAEAPEEVLPEEIVTTFALPEGEHATPVAGFVYFPCRKKAKSIRSVELVYTYVDGSAILRLR